MPEIDDESYYSWTYSIVGHLIDNAIRSSDEFVRKTSLKLRYNMGIYYYYSTR